MAFFKKKKEKEQEVNSATPDKEPAQTIPDPNATNQEKGLFQRLRQGLSKTRSSLTGRLDRPFLGKKETTEELLAAADTFRTAAVEQLTIWGERVGATVIKQDTGTDPSAVAFDALTAAVARKVDVVLVDTAGRLHTKINLMEELQKIHRMIGRKLPGAPHEVWLILDATTGQNAIAQAKTFNERFGVRICPKIT